MVEEAGAHAGLFPCDPPARAEVSTGPTVRCCKPRSPSLARRARSFAQVLRDCRWLQLIETEWSWAIRTAGARRGELTLPA